MFNQSQHDKLLRNLEIFAKSDISILSKNLDQKKYHAYSGNLIGLAENRLEKGMLLWRVGKNPRPAFLEALEYGEKTKSALLEFQPVFNDSRYLILVYVQIAAFLLEREFSVPEYSGKTIKMMAMQISYRQRLIEGLHRSKRITKEFEEIEIKSQKEKKRIQLYVNTQRIYAALLSGDGDIDGLVKQAESNYLKRQKNGFYGPSSILGGGPSNRYMIDLALAAILKKIKWQGDSRHKWIWD